jgi:hypothetical protein
VDALGSLLGLNLVDAVFRLASFLADGQDADGGDGFKRVAGFGANHANAKRCKVAGVKDRNGKNDCD